MADILPDSDSELDKRIAVLRRYRQLLELQRDRLEAYLAIVDARDQAVHNNDIDRLAGYAEREQVAIRGVLAVQECLKPLAGLYLEYQPKGAPEITDLEQRLERLRQEILRRNAETQTILRQNANQLKSDLGMLRAKNQPASVYTNAEAGDLVDLRG